MHILQTIRRGEEEQKTAADTTPCYKKVKITSKKKNTKFALAQEILNYVYKSPKCIETLATNENSNKRAL
jgi:hypothetical protein